MYIEPITLSFIITNSFILICYLSLVRKINKMANGIKIALVVALGYQAMKTALNQDDDCECCGDEEDDDR